MSRRARPGRASSQRGHCELRELGQTERQAEIGPVTAFQLPAQQSGIGCPDPRERERRQDGRDKDKCRPSKSSHTNLPPNWLTERLSVAERTHYSPPQSSPNQANEH